MPDTAEYLARIRHNAESKDPLAQQSDSLRVLAELIATAGRSRLTTRPATHKWSVGEILAHLAEFELASAWRYRQIVGGSRLRPT